jgi:hypothetical protein
MSEPIANTVNRHSLTGKACQTDIAHIEFRDACGRQSLRKVSNPRHKLTIPDQAQRQEVCGSSPWS